MGDDLNNKLYAISTVQELFKELDSSENGLTAEAAAAQLAVHGNNELKQPRKRNRPSPQEILAAQFHESATAVNVVRDGQTVSTAAKILVPGDVFYLKEGDPVPADARLLESTGLTVDMSRVTGECEPVKKSPEWEGGSPMEARMLVLCGATVMTGSCKCIVLTTGMKTVMGMVSQLCRDDGTTDLHPPISGAVMEYLAGKHCLVRIQSVVLALRDCSCIVLDTTGMMDPPREGVGAALQKARALGIHVVLATGDPAESFLECALLPSVAANVVSGADFETVRTQLPDMLNNAEDPSVLVLAGMTPVQKLDAHESLQTRFKTVHVGGSVHNAPACKRANVGVAMGISGSSVCQEASDIVLVNDSIPDFIDAIAYLRTLDERQIHARGRCAIS